MGNNTPNLAQTQSNTFDLQKFTKYIPQIPDSNKELQTDQQTIFIQQFKCIKMSSLSTNLQVSSHNKQQTHQDFKIQIDGKRITIIKKFQKHSDLQIYVSNLIKISKLLNMVMYDELNVQTHENPLTTIMSIDINQFKLIPDYTMRHQISFKMQLLQFVAVILKKIGNIYFCPEFIGQGSNGFYLLNFSGNSHHSSQEIFLGFFRWVFGEDEDFQTCMSLTDMPTCLPICLQEIYNCMHLMKTLKIQQLQPQLKFIKDKMMFLENRADSFYACYFFKKTQKHLSSNNWIFMKSHNEIYFYNFRDKHPHLGKLIRKKKKISTEECHLIFNPDGLQIMYIPENAKYFVKACQFQFQSFSSISDIEIKFKLPVKFKNAIVHKTRSGQYLILQQNLYRFLPINNKLVQQTKRISDYIFLTSTKESSYFIVKSSIDIFRNGIRIFYKGEQITLSLTGDLNMMQEITSIRMDIREVVFCIQVYKGVFLMMASKNMWILDLNFQCFFSFATISQIKSHIAISKSAEQSNFYNDNIFMILNQQFRVQFEHLNDGNNVAIRDNYLHILAIVQGNPHYLRYSFVHRIGALKLQGYHALYVESPYYHVIHIPDVVHTQEYKFNFHQENSNTYKYRNWIFLGDFFVKIYDFKIKWEKTNYQVFLQIQEIGETLKDYIQNMNKNNKKMNKMELLFILYRIFTIYEHLFNKNIYHKNISIAHLCFTKKKQLKIFGWSEPPKNWHVSDYKDFLLVCLNLITYNSYEKISDKIINKHQIQLNNYPIFMQKIQSAFKQAKSIQKKGQIQKNLSVLKSYLEKQLISCLQVTVSNKYIFSFEFNTPRMSILNTETQKMKKIVIITEQTIAEEFTFSETDKFAWNQKQSTLYIFTSSYQFFELKINLENYQQQKIILQDYEFLPQNISYCTFTYVPDNQLFAFGGIKKQQQGKSSFNNKVYKFNWKSLSWDPIADLPEPRTSPETVVSSCSRYVYIFGGSKEHQFQHLKIIKYDTVLNTCVLLVDKSSQNITSLMNKQLPLKIFHLSEQLCLFLFWYVEDGDYIVRYVSYLASGFDIVIRVKTFNIQGNLARQSVALQNSNIHILRPYGKYSKISINKLESASIKNQTIYAI